MQDSINDFIRIIKRTNHKYDDDKRCKTYLVTAQRKKECEIYASKIVEHLIEGKARTDLFLNSLRHINQDIYQDIVEERAITKICGYPLCGRKIPEMPKQKYIILSKKNKVYEISDRKNYCSNFCYEASLHIKRQIEMSPLWLRSMEGCPDFKLLPASCVGTPGKEIDQGIIKSKPEEPVFTSIAAFTELSLSEAAEMENTCSEKKTTKRPYTKSMSTINETDEECDPKLHNGDVTKQGNNYSSDEPVCKKEVKPNLTQTEKNVKVDKLAMLINKLSTKKERKIKLINPLPEKKMVVGESLRTIKSEIPHSTVNLKLTNVNETAVHCSGVNKCSVKITENNVERNVTVSKEIQMDYVNAFEQIRKYTKEWVTLETYVYIFGKDEIKHILNDKKLTEYFDKLKVAELQTVNQMKYMNICKKLRLRELAEDKFDNLILERKMKHLPDYDGLKVETKELDVKVKSFYGGTMYEQSDKNFPDNQKTESDEHLFLPALTAMSQNNTRKMVFLNSIDYSLQRFTRELRLPENVRNDIGDLVGTFKLQAHNVVLEPQMWKFAALILINWLSIKNRELETNMSGDIYVQFIELIFGEFQVIDDFVNDMMNMFKDVEAFIEYYVTVNDEPK